MKCTNCGAMLEADAAFCPECGSPVVVEEAVQAAAAPTIYCPMCGAALEEGTEWCTSCGVSLAATKKKEPMNFSIDSLAQYKKYLIPAAAAVGVLVVLILVISLFKGKELPIMYYKDDNLYASKWKEDSEVRVEKDFDGTWSALPAVSDDEKWLYYGEDEGNGYDLYRKKLKDLEGDEERIAKEVQRHVLLDNNKVVYLDRDGDLNVAKGEDSERMAKDVTEFYVNEKQTMVVWIDDEGDLYKRDVKMKKEDERIAKDIDYILDYTDNFEQIAYVADGAVYILDDYKEDKKVFESDDVYTYTTLVKEDAKEISFYFAEKADEDKVVAYDFVQDDMLAEDEDMKEPKEEDYQYTEIEKDWWGDPYEVTKISDEYYDAWDKYYEKESRDDWREYLKECEVSRQQYNIYYYTLKDGSEKLSTAYSCEFSTVSYSKELVLVSQITEMDSVTAKMSEFSSGDKNVYDFVGQLSNTSDSEKEVTLYNGKKGGKLKTSDGDYFSVVGVNGKKKIAYLLQREDGDSDYDLVSVKYGSKIGDMETIEQDVESALCLEDQLFYIVDEDLYCDGERIEKDVEYVTGRGTVKDSKWVALLLHEDSSEEGDLKLWNGKKLVDVEKDVYQYVPITKKKIVLLHDYSGNEGTLSIWDGKDTERLDKDVQYLFDIY